MKYSFSLSIFEVETEQEKVAMFTFSIRKQEKFQQIQFVSDQFKQADFSLHILNQNSNACILYI